MTETASAPTIGDHRVVSRKEWLIARKALLTSEKEATRHLDKVRAERRALPWAEVEERYVFEGPHGPIALADLFAGRSQLVVYHFMLAPGSDHICDGCALLSDHVDDARRHFEQADLSFAAVSRAPLVEIEAVKRRMGWRFPWLSSHGSDFNYDFCVSFTPEHVASGNVGYNYGTTPYAAEDLHGVSVFYKNAAGDIFHTYSAYARGTELLAGAFNWLDLAPKGRNENGNMSWVRLHDEYEVPAAVARERQADGVDACCVAGAGERAA
jgi:predicted dithiol-disulfide oxidoreductase (DUF899 family)